MAAGIRVPEHERDEVDSADLWRAWDDFAAALRAARGRAARETPDGLTHSQYRLLCAVSETPQARCGHLADLLGVAAPTVTRMLSGLENAGFVARVPAAEDRRGVCVGLTETGRTVLAAKQEVVTRKRRLLHESLSLAERRQATALFRRLAEELDVL
jgi:DNA-binding MarR family transcriptional regulator